LRGANIADTPETPEKLTDPRGAKRSDLHVLAESAIGTSRAEKGHVSIKFSTIDTMQSALTFHRERHTVLAGNIANLDTPGYKPLDLQRTTPTEGQTLSVTTDGHIGGASGASSVVTAFTDTDQMQGPDGNAVQLERELSKIDANRARYATSSELVSRRIAMLRYAAGDGT
jgi:flagellar basal-body rod protein FlgB